MSEREPDELAWIRARNDAAARRGMHAWLRRAFGSRRPPRAAAQGDDGSDDPGAAGAGRTAPLAPRPPELTGANARRIEDAPDFL